MPGNRKEQVRHMIRPEEHAVTFGSRTIRFTLKYSRRRTLGISVTPDTAVTVTAPEGKDIDRITSYNVCYTKLLRMKYITMRVGDNERRPFFFIYFTILTYNPIIH